MNFAVGHNLVGYLPESDVYVCETWDEAKAALIEDMRHAADSAATWADQHDCDNIPCPTYGDDCPRQEANQLMDEAENLTVSNGPEWSTIVYNMSWWVNLTEESADA